MWRGPVGAAALAPAAPQGCWALLFVIPLKLLGGRLMINGQVIVIVADDYDNLQVPLQP